MSNDFQARPVDSFELQAYMGDLGRGVVSQQSLEGLGVSGVVSPASVFAQFGQRDAVSLAALHNSLTSQSTATHAAKPVPSKTGFSLS